MQTPIARKQRDIFASAVKLVPGGTETLDAGRPHARQGSGKGHFKQKDEVGWETSDEEELYGGFSPPKTFQFMMPQSKLMQTPGESFAPRQCWYAVACMLTRLISPTAREASKRIVEDILVTAGAGANESSDLSPSMVKMNKGVLDDSF